MVITIWIIVQIIISIGLWFPAALLLIGTLRRWLLTNKKPQQHAYDYAVIVTAYQQVDLIPDVVSSILQTDYNNYLIYVVADNCDVSTLHFSDERVILLRPETVLAGNTKSHFYAIERFRRNHDILTIIDSDNLVDKAYFNELTTIFNKGFVAVQGVRRAKNLNSVYACLDEAGDIYYRFIDRKLLFEAGSSASLAGSGMAFTVAIFKECLEKMKIEGAGFDKVLQYELLQRNKRIAFAEQVIVYDEKTAKSDQLVKQRARWINTWFKYWILGIKMFFQSLFTFNWNKFSFGILLMRPPLFLTLMLSAAFFIADIIFMHGSMLWYWVLSGVAFIVIFFMALRYFKADERIYKSLQAAPKFIFYQILAFLKVRKANKISVATEHYTSKSDAEHSG